VIVDAATNTAWLSIGTSNTGSAYQSLDLGTGTFAAPIDSKTGLSEDIALDPILHLILSPNEAGTFEILQTEPTASLFENNLAIRKWIRLPKTAPPESHFLPLNSPVSSSLPI